MTRDHNRKRSAGGNRKGASRRREKPPASGWRWYGAGLLSGIFLSFLLYLGTLAPEHPQGLPQQAADPSGPDSPRPEPRFDFYTVLPEQTMEVDLNPEEVARARNRGEGGGELYLLQAGSFRNREDADRRRGELLLLGLEPQIEETDGDNGRWYRVFLGPFTSKSAMAKARSLTAAEGIDTLLLKRGEAR